MNYAKITNQQWNQMSEKSKIVAIQSILTSWKLNGKSIKYDLKWFLDAVESSIVDIDNTKLGERLELLAKAGNAFGERDALINKLMSQLTEDDKQKHLYIEDKVKEYKIENNQEFLSDKTFDEIINKCAKYFNIEYKEMFSIWDKVDKAHWGVEL